MELIIPPSRAAFRQRSRERRFLGPPPWSIGPGGPLVLELDQRPGSLDPGPCWSPWTPRKASTTGSRRCTHCTLHADI